MRDCKLIVTVRDDKVNFEGQDISVEELAQIAGFLQAVSYTHLDVYKRQVGHIRKAIGRNIKSFSRKNMLIQWKR